MVMALSLCTPTIVLRSPTLKLRVLVNPCGLRRPLNFIQNKRNGKQLPIALVRCSASPGNRPPSADISTSAKIRSEVLSPFRSVRMFFYLAFIASGGLGGLIALSRLIAALGNAPNAGSAPEILKGLGIDLAAVSLFAFLYTREWRAQKVQQARLSREEILANLKLEVDGKKVVSISQLRGFARLVIVAGPAAFIEEAFRLSEPFTNDLLDRGVRVVYYATDGVVPNLWASTVDSNLDEVKDAEQLPTNNRQKSLWQLTPIYTTEWSKWLNEQKSLAKVPEEKPVYISLRMDGRVRGSGVGYPPWNAFVAQLPPLKGLWAGVLDGMDGRV
uniref:TSA: Wollemia nobilis Ref_Wollemi_Transcript_29031_1282 transcribed RNA sequence n=1 Tax=Wollemia nobilis TaxID=56998 RepID=A0A0C9RPJ5_9CONI